MAKARSILWPELGVFYGQGQGYSMARARSILWPGLVVFYSHG